jgi:hypothetical protein
VSGITSRVAAVKELERLLPVILSALRFDAAGEPASSAQQDSAVSCTVPRLPGPSQQHAPPLSPQDMVHTAAERGAAATRTTRTTAKTCFTLFLLIS